MKNTWSLLLPVLFPMICGLLTGFLPALKEGTRRRTFILASLIVTLFLTVWQIFLSNASVRVLTLAPGMEIRFQVDAVTRFFAGLIAFMWLMSGIFSFEYMKHEKNHSRYYAFFLLGEGSMLGVAFAANYVTMYLCFEWMTLMTLPLVLHSQTEEAVKAGMKYLLYSFAGAFAGLLGIPFLARYGTTLDFIPGGVLDMTLVQGHEGLLLGIAFAVILGFGAKAGLFPLHAWLPTAHPVAPAPASAVLSGVITKNGKPKRGLVVSILGTDQSCTTDKYGRFYFKDAAPGEILQIDITARKAARIELSEARRLKVYIAPSDFVYNNGRIEQRLPYTAIKSDAVVRGNMVMHDQIMSSGLQRVSDLLKNFVTGVRVEQTAMGSSIVMRGPSSIIGSNSPLFVVDGVVIESLEEVDRLVPVETIEKLVLNKEGTGWGARGGNGVIEITTLGSNI